MAVRELKGSIFTSEAQVIVNTINCEGVMGAGLALECRLRYPDMFDRYVKICQKGLLEPGKLWLYKDNNPWILNFPTKKHWRYPSKESYLRDGLQKFCDTYKSKEIMSIAFPLLGADKGGLDENVSRSILMEYLSDLDIDIEIYEYDPSASDTLYLELEEWFLSTDLVNISKLTGIKVNYLALIEEAMNGNMIFQIGQISSIKGVGISTLEKLLSYKFNGSEQSQKSLF
ncbi:macro domain-containing protein [Psychrobacter namhaensis]|uniref:macro domain-containing protein n=1 Tax=Psychrobacter namhaensis TaxID=292734 RepID=UPI0018DF9051|nr:macro domain-containing protein [Psychrobacter namhaensis]